MDVPHFLTKKNQMSNEKYYIISSSFHDVDGMMLGNMPDLPDDMEDDWMFGQQFSIEPEEPIIIGIQEGNENCTPLPFYKSPPIATQALIDALVEVGVDNIVTYDVILKSRTDPSITISGYKAINVIGLVKAVGNETAFLTDSQIGDASMKNIILEPSLTKGLNMFRLAESMRTIVVHEKVKQHLESKGFNCLKFTEVGEAFLL